MICACMCVSDLSSNTGYQDTTVLCRRSRWGNPSSGAMSPAMFWRRSAHPVCNAQLCAARWESMDSVRVCAILVWPSWRSCRVKKNQGFCNDVTVQLLVLGFMFWHLAAAVDFALTSLDDGEVKWGSSSAGPFDWEFSQTEHSAMEHWPGKISATRVNFLSWIRISRLLNCNSVSLTMSCFARDVFLGTAWRTVPLSLDMASANECFWIVLTECPSKHKQT